jgi:hypothetical protein
LFKTIPTIRRVFLHTLLILLAGCLFPAVTAPCLALSEPFPEFIAAFEDHMNLDLTECPDELEGSMGGYVLWCGETDLDFPAFRKSWKKAKRRIRGMEEFRHGKWTSTQEETFRALFGFFGVPALHSRQTAWPRDRNVHHDRRYHEPVAPLTSGR